MALEPQPPDLDLVASSLRADSADLGAFVGSLAAKLEEALPGRTQVERGRSGMFGPKVVRKISVELDDGRLELVVGDRDRLDCRRARVSGGITLKTEKLELDSWTAALSAALVEEAGRSERARKALERILLG